MKKVALVAALLVAAAGGLPYWFGMQAEKSYRAAAAEWSQPGQLALEVRAYRRGWLSSEAELLLSLPAWELGTGTGGPDLRRWGRWVQTDRIAHGPLPAVRPALGVGGFRPALAALDTRIEPEDAPEALAAALGGRPAVTARTVIRWDGSGHTVLEGPALELEVGEVGRVSWQGLTGTLEWPGGGRFRGTLGLPGAAWKGEGVRGGVEGATATFDLERGVENLILGEYRLAVARVAAQGPQGPGMVLEGIAALSSAVALGDSIHASTSLEVKAVTAAAESYGPVELGLVARNLDAPTLARWQALASELQSRAGDEGPGELAALVQERFRELVPAFLARSPQVELSELRLGTPHGEVTATGLLGFDGAEPVSLDRVEELLGRVRAEARFRVPREAARRVAVAQARQRLAGRHAAAGAELDRASRAVADQELEGLVAQRLLEFDGRAYTCGLSWTGERLQVNGNTLYQVGP